jgi:branched-chain amino acid transport system substrate-binding protein
MSDMSPGGFLVRRNTRIAMLLALGVCLVLAACGSRRPVSDFEATGTGAQGSGLVPGTTNGSAAPGVAGSDGTTGSDGSTSGLPGDSTSGGSGPTTSGGGGDGGGGAPQGSGTTNGKPNTASDVGVTATSIRLGNIVTRSGSFGPNQFTAFYYGAAAYFDYINSQGGINGRKVTFNNCDDKGTAGGNNDCAHSLAGDGTNGVFAFVANDCLVCDGLKYISEKGIPSVGGVAIDFSDYGNQHSWRYSGQMYPQNGQIGYKGNLYLGTQMFHYFKVELGVTKAAVVYYDNSSQSKTAGQSFIKGLEREGIKAYPYGENVALPQWDSAVIDMKSKGVEAVFDAIDISGNQKLCKSIDSNHFVPKAKVSTISTWSQEVGTTFDYPCRSYIYSTDLPGSLGYDQTDNPEIAKFRAAMKNYFPERENLMYQWNVDGWASAMWFTDAAKSCGADLTRKCLEAYLNRPKPYGAHGIWYPRNNVKYNFETKKTLHQCISVAHWEEKRKSFVTVGDYHDTCYTSPYIPYPSPTSSSS